MALGLCIKKLVEAGAHRQQHIPYRDSKLTFLLQVCVGGHNRKAAWLAAWLGCRSLGSGAKGCCCASQALLVPAARDRALAAICGCSIVDLGGAL